MVAEKTEHNDIDEVIKRYEEETKEKLPSEPSISKKEKKNLKISKPISKILTAIGGVLVVIIIFFVFFKNKNKIKKIQPPKKQIQIEERKESQTKQVDGIPLFGNPQKIESLNGDGINTKIYKTNSDLKSVQLFYQKAMTDKGYVIDSYRESKGKSVRFKKDDSEVVLNLISEGENTIILLSYKK